MASSTTFILEDTELPDNFGESIMDESDFEDFGAARSVANHASRHYWFGKRVFTQVLKDVVFNDNPSAETGDDLDVSFTTRRSLLWTRLKL